MLRTSRLKVLSEEAESYAVDKADKVITIVATIIRHRHFDGHQATIISKCLAFGD